MLQSKRFLYILIMMVGVLCLCVGCNSARKEEQLQLREQGINYLENGQYEKAIEVFQEALDASLGEIGETELDICFYKAEAQYLLGDTEAAMDTYTAIIEYNDSPKAYYLRGNLYYSMEEELAAMKDYEAAIKYEKKDYDLYIGIYESLVAHDKVPEGVTYLNQALDIKGEEAYDNMKKGWIQYLLGNNEEALDLLEKAAEGEEEEAYYYLVEVNLAMNDIEAAQDNMEAYIASGIADSYRLYHIAEAQLSKGNYDMSISCLEAALELKQVPNRQAVMRTLVIAYEKINDFVAARDVLTDYVKLYPEDEEAKDELTFLETR